MSSTPLGEAVATAVNRTAAPTAAGIGAILEPAAAAAGALAAPAAAAAPSAASAVAAAPLTATSLLSPAAVARAKKLASGGMAFVEGPGRSFMSQRNLAPPPSPPAVHAAADASTALVPAAAADATNKAAAAAGAVTDSSSPAAASFSFVRWVCTSRSAWSWLVRALLVSGAVGTIYAAHKIYLAWLADMQRRHALRVARAEAARNANRLNAAAVSSSSSAGGDDSKTANDEAVRGGAGSSSGDRDGLANFVALTTIISRRYKLLQRYAAILKHVRFESSSAAAAAATGASPSTAAAAASAVPSQQGDAAKLTAVFDELDAVLAENVYLKDLLRRLHSQIEWSSVDADDKKEEAHAVAPSSKQRSTDA